MTYGYIRVSTDKQTVENQRFEVENYCRKNELQIDEWMEDVESGKVLAKKRKLGAILLKAKKGDMIIISEITRIGRSMFNIMSVLHECMERGIKIIAIKEGWKLGIDLQSKMMAMLFSMAAEIERSLISSRTREALARKKAEGVILGRPIGRRSATVKLTGREEQIRALRMNRVSYSAIGRIMGVHRLTVSDFIQTRGLDCPRPSVQ